MSSDGCPAGIEKNQAAIYAVFCENGASVAVQSSWRLAMTAVCITRHDGATTPIGTEYSVLIIDRYIIKDVFYTFLGVITVLSLIFVSGQLITLYSRVAGGSLPLKSVMTMLGLDSISNLVVILPLAFYIGILLSLTRLHKDHEMVVLAASGISEWRVLRALLGLALILSFIVGIFAMFLAPWANAKGETLLSQAKEQSELEGLAAGRFKELTHGEGVFYIQEFNNKTGAMGNVFLQQDDKYKNSIISAMSGIRMTSEQSGDKYFVMLNGYRYDTQIRSDRPDQQPRSAVIRFERHGILLQDDAATQKPEFRLMAISSLDLWQRAQLPDMSELQKRISTVIVCLVLAVLSLPLSRTSPRQGRYTKLAMALLLFIIYSNMLNVSAAWTARGVIPTWIGLWWVHLLALLIGLMLYLDWHGFKWRWRKLLRGLGK